MRLRTANAAAVALTVLVASAAQAVSAPANTLSEL